MNKKEKIERELKIIDAANSTINKYKEIIRTMDLNLISNIGKVTHCKYCQLFKGDSLRALQCDDCILSNGKYKGCVFSRSLTNVFEALSWVKAYPNNVYRELAAKKMLHKRIEFHWHVIRRSKRRLTALDTTYVEEKKVR
jgi:hypothetical protein